MKDCNCGYCMGGEILAGFGIKICDLKVSQLILFKEQSHPGRVIVAYKDHVSELVDISDEERNLFFADVLVHSFMNFVSRHHIGGLIEIINFAFAVFTVQIRLVNLSIFAASVVMVSGNDKRKTSISAQFQNLFITINLLFRHARLHFQVQVSFTQNFFHSREPCSTISHCVILTDDKILCLQ